MPVETDPDSYKSDDPALLREIVDSAEARLQAQLTAALAADQRALVLAGFLSAALVALVGGAGALLLAEPREGFLAAAALVVALGFLSALVLTVFAARPTDWCYPGTRPGSWIKDISSKKAEPLRLAELCADLHRKITDNAELMKTNGRVLISALILAALSLAIGGLALVCFSLNAG